jgi:PIF1-like helicase
VDEDPNVDIGSLVDNQRRIFLRVVEHYRRILNQEQPPPLRLSLPLAGALSELTAAQHIHLQGRFDGIHFVIIDEKSMIGRKMLSKVNARLGQAYSETRDNYFGGSSVLLFGDFGQLPPVGDTPLYDLAPRTGPGNHAELNNGRHIYLSMTESIKLNCIFLRQRREDPQSLRFREVLQHLCGSSIVPEDIQFLNQRYIHDLPPQEKAVFDNALHLCPTN